jgi:hypothetical protein
MKRKKFDALISEKERRALELLAISDGGLSLAAEIRFSIKERALEKGLWPGIEPDEVLRARASEQGRQYWAQLTE